MRPTKETEEEREEKSFELVHNVNAMFFEDRRASQDDEQLLEEIVFGEETPKKRRDESWQYETRHSVACKEWEYEEERGTISLWENKKLRKLRKHKEENFLSTKEYEQRLRQLFVEKNHFALEWSQQPDNNSSLCQPQVARKATDEPFTVKDDKKDSFSWQKQSDWISFRRLADANQQDPCHSTVFATEFHPGGRLLLVGGLDKVLRLFSVDGQVNPKVESVYYANLPIRCAHFILDASRILCAGRRRFLYELDLVSGQSYPLLLFQDRYESTFEKFQVSWNGDRLGFVGDNGKIVLFDSKTKEETGCLYSSPGLHDLSFSPQGLELLSCGDDGMIHRFDLRMNRCIEKWTDQGASSLLCIRTWHTKNTFAVGNADGFVHLYRVAGASFTLCKAFSNLTTAIQDVCFHPEYPLLAFASNIGKNQVRLANISRQTVYRNWPPPHLQRIQTMTMSEQYLAMGNDHGRVVLYNLVA
jgi:U3 small nucleolar RNA-associated protein 18